MCPLFFKTDQERTSFLPKRAIDSSFLCVDSRMSSEPEPAVGEAYEEDYDVEEHPDSAPPPNSEPAEPQAPPVDAEILHKEEEPENTAASPPSNSAPPQPEGNAAASETARKPDGNESKPSPRRAAAAKDARATNGVPRLVVPEKDDLQLLYLPPNERPAVVDEHERHKERLDAIASGRSASQGTSMSRMTYASTSSRRSSPRNTVDPVTVQLLENHKKALGRLMRPGPQKLPLVHITHCTRLGNTHGHKEEFVNPHSPREPLNARERRLHNNNFRSERLNAAERVDEENAKFVSALINVKPVVCTTTRLLDQERVRQTWLRQIERGPSKTSSPPRGSVVAANAAQREAVWNNRVSNVIPRPPAISTSTAMEHSSRPKVLWEDKLTQARELERRKLASLQNPQSDNEAEGTPRREDGTTGAQKGGKKTSRPKPPPSTLVDCMEKVPPVNSGRHRGHGSSSTIAADAKGDNNDSRAAGHEEDSAVHAATYSSEAEPPQSAHQDSPPHSTNEEALPPPAEDEKEDEAQTEETRNEL